MLYIVVSFVVILYIDYKLKCLINDANGLVGIVLQR